MNHKIAQMEIAPEEKSQDIYAEIVHHIADTDQHQRKLDVIRKELLAEKSVKVTDVHILQSVEAENTSKEDIHEQSTEKANNHAFFFPTHESE